MYAATQIYFCFILLGWKCFHMKWIISLQYFWYETHILHPLYPIANFPITTLVKFLRWLIKRTAKLIITILLVFSFFYSWKDTKRRLIASIKFLSSNNYSYFIISRDNGSNSTNFLLSTIYIPLSSPNAPKNKYCTIW